MLKSCPRHVKGLCLTDNEELGPSFGEKHIVLQDLLLLWLFFWSQFLCKLKQRKQKFFVSTSFLVLCKAPLCLVTCTEQTTTQVSAQFLWLKPELWLHIHQHSLVCPEPLPWEHPQGSLHCCCVEAARAVLKRLCFKSLFFPFSFFYHRGEERDITLRRGFTSDVLRNI